MSLSDDDDDDDDVGVFEKQKKLLAMGPSLVLASPPQPGLHLAAQNFEFIVLFCVTRRVVDNRIRTS